jgi:hypothetical protein
MLSFILLGIALILLLAWAFSFVLFHITTLYIHILLILAVIFLLLHRIAERHK